MNFVYQFRLQDGLIHVPHYGLLLAGVAGLPTSVVETARGITARITEKVLALSLIPIDYAFSKFFSKMKYKQSMPNFNKFLSRVS